MRVADVTVTAPSWRHFAARLSFVLTFRRWRRVTLRLPVDPQGRVTFTVPPPKGATISFMATDEQASAIKRRYLLAEAQRPRKAE